MKNELILFETADKEIKLNVSVKDSTVWLNRNQLAELFERDVKTIGKHINNALKEELDNSVVAKFATTEFPFFISFDFLLFICLYLRLAIISRHRHINRIIISIDILQLLLLLFQPFDLPCGSGRGKAAQSLKVATS